MVSWYLRHAADYQGGADAELAAAALALLVQGLPPAEADAARADMLAVLRKRFKDSGTPPPDWLKG